MSFKTLQLICKALKMCGINILPSALVIRMGWKIKNEQMQYFVNLEFYYDLIWHSTVVDQETLK